MNTFIPVEADTNRHPRRRRVTAVATAAAVLIAGVGAAGLAYAQPDAEAFLAAQTVSASAGLPALHEARTDLYLAQVADAEHKAEVQARKQAEERSARAAAQRDPRGIARAMLAERGMGDDQFRCLDSLWTKESNWNYQADNPSSSAYGIPQALPGSKMASAGADWATNPATQIEWGLGYIEDVYGSPCSAWSHSQSYGWY